MRFCGVVPFAVRRLGGLVNQLDAIGTAGTRGSANFVQESKQHPGVLVGRRTQTRLHPEVQNGEPPMRGSHEHRDAQWAAQVRNREQGLYADGIADADTQSTFMLVDFGDAIGFDRLLYAAADTVLIDVEEKQAFERRALCHR